MACTRRSGASESRNIERDERIDLVISILYRNIRDECSLEVYVRLSLLDDLEKCRSYGLRIAGCERSRTDEGAENNKGSEGEDIIHDSNFG